MTTNNDDEGFSGIDELENLNEGLQGSPVLRECQEQLRGPKVLRELTGQLQGAPVLRELQEQLRGPKVLRELTGQLQGSPVLREFAKLSQTLQGSPVLRELTGQLQGSPMLREFAKLNQTLQGSPVLREFAKLNQTLQGSPVLREFAKLNQTLQGSGLPVLRVGLKALELGVAAVEAPVTTQATVFPAEDEGVDVESIGEQLVRSQDVPAMLLEIQRTISTLKSGWREKAVLVVLIPVILAILNPIINYYIQALLPRDGQLQVERLVVATFDDPSHLRSLRLVTLDGVRVRSGWSKSSPTVGTLHAGELVTVLAKRGRHTLVGYADRKQGVTGYGWVYSKRLRRIRESK